MRNSQFSPFVLFRKLFNIPEKLPRLIQVEITNCCNLDCPMCIRNFIELPIRHMDFSIFKKVIDNLDGVETVTLVGYGEPLLYPNIHEAIHYCKIKGKKVQITTNGLLLRDEGRIVSLIDSGLDSLSFSIESISSGSDIGHDNLQVLDNIEQLLNERKRRGAAQPEVTLQTLMLHGKINDLYEVIAWGAARGVDRINVVRFDLNTLPGVKRPDLMEEKQIFKQLDKLRKKHSIRIDCIQDRFYAGFKGLLYKYGKFFMGLDRNCIRLQDFSYVNVDGKIRPCCALINHEMGDLLISDLSTIWNNKKYLKFRETHKKITWCSRCDAFTLKQKN